MCTVHEKTYIPVEVAIRKQTRTTSNGGPGSLPSRLGRGVERCSVDGLLPVEVLDLGRRVWRLRLADVLLVIHDVARTCKVW